MESVPKTRGRHALRWILGVALAFLVLVGVACDMARSRAFERWLSVNSHWAEELHLHPEGLEAQHTFSPLMAVPLSFSEVEAGRDSFFMGRREVQWEIPGFALNLRQERAFFGNSIEARQSGGELAQVEAARSIFAEVRVELIVEP